MIEEKILVHYNVNLVCTTYGAVKENIPLYVDHSLISQKIKSTFGHVFNLSLIEQVDEARKGRLHYTIVFQSKCIPYIFLYLDFASIFVCFDYAIIGYHVKYSSNSLMSSYSYNINCWPAGALSVFKLRLKSYMESKEYAIQCQNLIERT